MTSETGIRAWGTYLPMLRMQRDVIAAQVGWMDTALKSMAKGRRTVANWDEDAITMAVAAARVALAPHSDTACRSLVFATTTAPFLDRSNAGLIAEALALDENTGCQDVGGSQRAATTAMLKSLQAHAAGTTLVVAADRRPARPGSIAEMRNGDAAAAFVLGPGPGVARIVGSRTLNRDFVHQYRTQERNVDYILEDRWVRDAGVLKTVPSAIEALAASCDVDVAAIQHLVLPLPHRHNRKVCAQLGIPETALCDDLTAEIGDTGVAHPLLQLAHTLESAEPGALICLVGFGQGCDVALFEVTAAINERRTAATVAAAMAGGVPLTQYLKLPVFGRQLTLDRGIRSEADKRTAMSVYARRHREINAMQGSRCVACGTPHFPRARVCVSCRAVDDMQPCGFAHRNAHLKTFTEDWQSATPVPPLYYGNVAFEGGGNAFLELTDVEPGLLQIGTPLSMHFRIKDFDDKRGFRRYFWKPAPTGKRPDG